MQIAAYPQVLVTDAGHPLAATPACFSIGGDAYVPPFAYLACPKAALPAIRVGRQPDGLLPAAVGRVAAISSQMR